MAERLVTFADKSSDAATTSTASYQLLALPPALLDQLASTSPNGPLTPLEIRGDPSDSAVIVTATQTYSIRGVQNSNSLCICASGTGEGKGRRKWFVAGGGGSGSAVEVEENDAEGAPARKKPRTAAIEIEAVLHETLELIPTVARVDKLDSLLKGAEFTGDSAEDEKAVASHPTFDSLRSHIPASDTEIRDALSRKRVVTLNGYLRPFPPSCLAQILPSIVSCLPPPPALAHSDGGMKKKDKGKAKDVKPVVQGAVWAEAEEQDLLDSMDAVDCGNEEIGGQVLGWFGSVVDGGRKRWKLDAAKLVKELGMVLLAAGGFGQQPLDPFIAKWKGSAGGFARLCELSLLAGVHLHRPPPVSTIQYLPPSSLSPDPAARFAELFSLQSRWLESEMGLFIDDLTGGDKKKRDALVLKFVRKVRDKETTWWTARNLWT
ncbi:sister chromatid cohesion protein [Rhodotorula toruloides]|uniref:Sister chromatid cohesion protein n=1 Tax=Rhodotorula toruloides TaxID=5286 RepID=A0A511KDW3_RHOTO|nr:sister chromatid cohesion protein [Rhodotorula toruloides]